MTRLADFKKWLWGDWGKPNFLTRAGIPRLVTNFASFLLAPYIFFALTLKYSSEVDKQSIRQFVHDPFVLLSYAVLYLSAISYMFLEFSFNLKNIRPDERFRLVRQRWKDPFVKIFWVSVLSSMFLLLIGGFHFRHQLK
jgi:hypothetical protein